MRLLIVDDEDDFRETLRERFERKRFEVATAPDAEVALGLIEERSYDVMLLDVRMPGMDGLTFLRHARDRLPFVEVIVISAWGSIDSAITAIKNGAYTFLTKPVRMAELDATVERAFERSAMSRDRRVFEAALSRAGAPAALIHCSDEMKAVVELAERVAPSGATILIEGETGTGKEVLANHIHRRSARAQGPFVVVDCGTLSESILERELFGHQRGAYTGAVDARPGLVAVAEGGTLLIDEIGHTSLAVQGTLLRLIERGVFRRLGDPREIAADVRIIAATNRDLEERADRGEFREDLFYRLNVIRLRIPPLRERKTDILPLVSYFLSRYSPARQRPRRLVPEAEVALMAYDWPGNVRELANVIERACLVAPSPEIEPHDLRIDAGSRGDAGPLCLAAAERRHIAAVMQTAHGDKARAAELLGITLRHLYRKLKKHTLESE